jgi:putative transposase
MSTYSQIYIHIIFAVKRRQHLIQPSWEDDLFKYISGIIHFKNQKLIAINGSTDHIHILIGMKPACSLSDLVRGDKKIQQ